MSVYLSGQHVFLLFIYFEAYMLKSASECVDWIKI
jgi:hypothetical protein